MPEIMIFKSGKYPQGDWPKERVQRLVAAYDPDKSIEAAVVIGHRAYADTDEAQFAHGWVKSLRLDGAGRVYAEIPEFSDQAVAAIAEKKLRYVSAEIYEFDQVDASQPPYLKAVALLGRDTPAIATTRLPSLFALLAGGTVATVDEKLHIASFTRKVSVEEFNTLKAESFKEEESTKLNEEEKMGEVDKLQAELAKSNEELATYKRENQELKSSGKKTDAETYFAKLRDEGKLYPSLFEQAVALDIKLGEAERKEFRSLLANLQTKVDLSGTHQADKQKAGQAETGNAKLTAKIRAYQKEHKLTSFADAAAALHAQQPEFFKEGAEA